MRSGLWYRFEGAVRGLTPFILTLLLAMLTVVPLRIPDFAQVTPSLTVIAVYYWSIYRPDLLPLAAVFGVGLFQDALAGTPLGLTALVLISVQYAVISQRRFFHGKSFLVEWWGFMLVAPVAALASWLLAAGRAVGDAVVEPARQFQPAAIEPGLRAQRPATPGGGGDADRG